MQAVGAILAVALACVLAPGCDQPEGMPETMYQPLALKPTDRILVLAPHPDDEVLGCAGVLQTAQAMGLPVRVVFFTYGDNNEWSFTVYRKHPVLVPASVRRMGELRRTEALNAAEVLGLVPGQLTFLGYPDFGTYRIWTQHWADEPPLRSMLTRVNHVPYPDALRAGAPYKGEDVLRDLTTILREFKPTRVFVSHPADHNPDHRALYLFTTVALWDLRDEMQPEVSPYLVHFPRWPKPRGRHPDGTLLPPARLGATVAWKVLPLTPEQSAAKEAALRRHRTQTEYSGKYLMSFIRRNELFGNMPTVRLASGTDDAVVNLEAEPGLAEASEELTVEEAATFDGVEGRRVARHDGMLDLHFRLTRPLDDTITFELNLFGYRGDAPFARMPKLRVMIGPLYHHVFDQSRALAGDRILVRRTSRELIVQVPLSLLGAPERILTSAHTSRAELPIDWLAWRVLELEPLTPRR